jgi:hypothetical protein
MQCTNVWNDDAKMYIVKTTLAPSPSAASMVSGSSSSRTRSIFGPRRISSTNVRLLRDCHIKNFQLLVKVFAAVFLFTPTKVFYMYRIFGAHHSACTKKFCYVQQKDTINDHMSTNYILYKSKIHSIFQRNKNF